MTQTILSSNGIHRLHHTFFVPKIDIKASLLIVHGMSEHSGRYDKFAKFLADNGVLVATYDQLGHGRTVKDNYELGFFDDKHPVQILSKDVIIMTKALKTKAKELTDKPIPTVIMGHSMGSFIVRTVLTHHATSFDGVILMGTANTFNILNKTAKIALKLANLYQPKKPNQRFAYLLNRYLFNKIGSLTDTSYFAWLSENTQAVKDFENDPLTGFAFTNNGFYTLQALIEKACDPSWHTHLTAPILLISGKDDPVGNMGYDIDELHDELIWANKQVSKQLYVNMRHEPLQETNSKQVFFDILHWIEKI